MLKMDFSYDIWIFLIGALCAAACALPGSFLLLRRMSLMSDAISHAVLPGLALAFIFTGQRTSSIMFIGAVLAGLLTAALTQWIHKKGRMEEGASMGIVFTSLFALGLLLIAQGAHHVELDADCVLFGSLELTPLDTIKETSLLGMTIALPRAAVVLGVVLLVNIGIILLFFKELRITTFDPDLALSLGYNPAIMHYMLMTMVAVTAVAAFEVVGSIIVIALFIVPPATASLVTRRLSRFLFASVAFGILAVLLGHPLSIWLPGVLGYNGTSSAGMMGLLTGVIFLVAFLFSPQTSLLRRFKQRRSH